MEILKKWTVSKTISNSLIYVSLESQKEKWMIKGWADIEEIIAKKVSNLIKNTNRSKKLSMPLSRVNIKKIILRYVVTKNQRERENLVNSQRKRHIGEQRARIQTTADFSTENTKAREQGKTIFKVLKKSETINPEFYIQVTTCFKNRMKYVF